MTPISPKLIKIPVLVSDTNPHGGMGVYYNQLIEWPQVKEFGARVVFSLSEIPQGPWWRVAWLLLKNYFSSTIVGLGQWWPLGGCAALLPGGKYILFCHGLDALHSNTSFLKRIAITQLLKKTKVLIVNSFSTAQKVRLLYREIPSVLVAPPPLPIDFPDVEKWPKPTFRPLHSFLWIGRNVPRKGLNLLLQSWKSFKFFYPDARLTILGAKGFVIDQKAYRDVIHLPNVGNIDKWNLMQQHDALIWPSLELLNDYEGFGIVALEAAAMGLRIIASPTGGMLEAMYVPAILCITSDTNLAHSLADACATHARDSSISLKMLREQQAWVRKYHFSTQQQWQDASLGMYHILRNE